MSTVITGHTRNAGAVLGVHGGDGIMHWVRLATGSHLYGNWDGIEWVGFEPGGRAGLHTHSHTEEIWYILAGTGHVELDGVGYDVEPGSIVVTPLHSKHSMQNTGTGRLEYVVIEVFPPEINTKLPPRRPTDEDDATHGATRQTQENH